MKLSWYWTDSNFCNLCTKQYTKNKTKIKIKQRFRRTNNKSQFQIFGSTPFHCTFYRSRTQLQNPIIFAWFFFEKEKKILLKFFTCRSTWTHGNCQISYCIYLSGQVIVLESHLTNEIQGIQKPEKPKSQRNQIRSFIKSFVYFSLFTLCKEQCTNVNDTQVLIFLNAEINQIRNLKLKYLVYENDKKDKNKVI